MSPEVDTTSSRTKVNLGQVFDMDKTSSGIVGARQILVHTVPIQNCHLLWNSAQEIQNLGVVEVKMSASAS